MPHVALSVNTAARAVRELPQPLASKRDVGPPGDVHETSAHGSLSVRGARVAESATLTMRRSSSQPGKSNAGGRHTRQGNKERASLAEFALQPDSTAVQFNQPA